MKLDISNLSSKYNKTMLYYIMYVFEDYTLCKEELESFIKNEVGNYDDILKQLDNDLLNLKKDKGPMILPMHPLSTWSAIHG